MKSKLSKYGEEFARSWHRVRDRCANIDEKDEYDSFISQLSRCISFTTKTIDLSRQSDVYNYMKLGCKLPYQFISIDTNVGNEKYLILANQLPTDEICVRVAFKKPQNIWLTTRFYIKYFDTKIEYYTRKPVDDIDTLVVDNIREILKYGLLVIADIVFRQNLYKNGRAPVYASVNSNTAPELPFDSHHIRVVDTDKSEHTPSGITHRGTAKREHQRAGSWHTRKKSGKRYWVRACIVKEGAAGKITKEYLIK
jgi:hypothetical protein